MAKQLKAQHIREMTLPEINTKLVELQEELFNLRFRNAMKQLDDPLRIRIIKREVARLKTVLREQKLGIKKVASGSS